MGSASVPGKERGGGLRVERREEGGWGGRRRGLDHTETGSVKRLHVKNVDPLHFSENLQSFETGGLFEVGGDGARFGARADQVLRVADFCSRGQRYYILGDTILWREDRFSMELEGVEKERIHEPSSGTIGFGGFVDCGSIIKTFSIVQNPTSVSSFLPAQ